MATKVRILSKLMELFYVFNFLKRRRMSASGSSHYGSLATYTKGERDLKVEYFSSRMYYKRMFRPRSSKSICVQHDVFAKHLPYSFLFGFIFWTASIPDSLGLIKAKSCLHQTSVEDWDILPIRWNIRWYSVQDKGCLCEGKVWTSWTSSPASVYHFKSKWSW